MLFLCDDDIIFLVSTVLMSVADTPYKFICMDVEAYDREHDASIFAQSAFGTEMQDRTV